MNFSCMIGYEQEESVTKYRTETRKEEYLKVGDEYIGTEKVSKLVNATRYVDDYVPYTDTKTYYSWTQYENSIHGDNSAISLVDDYIIVDPQIYSKDKIKKDFKGNIVSLFRSGTIKEKASISKEQKQEIAEIAIEDLIDQSLPGDTYEKLNYRYSIDNTEVKYVELDCANISIGGFIISLIKVKGNIYCLLPKETYSSFKKFFIYKAAYPLILQLYYNDYSDYSDSLHLDDVPDIALNDYSFAAKSIMLKYVEKAKNLQQLNKLFKCNEMPLLTNKESNDILKHDGNDSLDEYIRKMNIYIQGYTLLSRKLHSAAKQEFRKILGFKNATKEYNKISDHLKKMTVYVVLATIIMLAIVIPIFIAIMKNMLH